MKPRPPPQTPQHIAVAETGCLRCAILTTYGSLCNTFIYPKCLT